MKLLGWLFRLDIGVDDAVSLLSGVKTFFVVVLAWGTLIIGLPLLISHL